MAVSGAARRRPLSLLNLCVGFLGLHLTDVIDSVHIFAAGLPASIKWTLLAIARRRGVLCDQLLTALADEEWEVLDLSGSEVSDAGVLQVAELCPRLRAVDVSRCGRLSSPAVLALVHRCSGLQTLRLGGSGRCNLVARDSLLHILPKLNIQDDAEDSWENLDTSKVAKGAVSLRWLLWPGIDAASSDLMRRECPRVRVNPRPAAEVPREAVAQAFLDDPAVEGLQPEILVAVTAGTEAARGVVARLEMAQIPIAEKFRLAFAARDERLVSKRAKNWRQNQRRAEKAWLRSDPEAKARMEARKLGLNV